MFIVDLELSDGVKSLLTEITVPEDCQTIGKPLVELGMPKTALISLIERKGKYIVPNGTTMLESGDKLFVISENHNDIEKVFNCLAIPVQQT